MNAPSSVTMRLIGELAEKLTARKQQLVVAESCTGGELLAALSGPAGASAWLWGGWVVYSNQAKMELGVAQQRILRHGAVSQQVVASLCACSRQKSGVAAAIAISGIAGPHGGSEKKPVGCVWVGASYEKISSEKLLQLAGNRATIRAQACEHAVRILLQLMKDYE